jgi:uncharacterized repeat protein (TIGR03803 family)
MRSKRQFCNSLFRNMLRAAPAALTIAIMLALAAALTPAAQAQTFSVIHTFSVPEGTGPVPGVTLDAAGNLYGTASAGASNGDGTVFELKPWRGTWILNSLFRFNGNNGSNPYSGVVFGPDGALYGTTYAGGSGDVGVVYSLRPPVTACKTVLCPWTETILYQFAGGSDGGYPAFGNLIFDQAGNIYGTTSLGGTLGQGTVFKLTPSNGGWTETVLYSFTGGSGGSDGAQPWSGVIFDRAGNLYGTTVIGGGSGCGGGGCGTVYQLTAAGSGWKENTLYSFQGGSDGYNPYAGLIFDQSGNLCGGTWLGGSGGYSGTVFELSPAGGGWTFTVLYSPNGGGGPVGNLALDATGVLYGTTGFDGAYSNGSVFKLTPSNGGWIYTGLHDFCPGGNCNDGSEPTGSVSWDASGNLYGTTYGGGAYGNGVVWEITP